MPEEPKDPKEVNMKRAQLVRLYEANCGIEHPTQNDLLLRDALGNAVKAEFQLFVKKELPPRAAR